MKIKRKKQTYKAKPVSDDKVKKGLESMFVKQKEEKQSSPQEQQRMNIPNPFGGGTGERKFNVPNPMGAKSAGGNIPNPMGGKINVGQSKATLGKFNAPNEWGVQPLNLPKPQQQPQQIQHLQQAQLEDFQQEESEEEPYWSAEEWEQWAYEIATVSPEAQQYLPPWFIQALKEEEQ